MRGTAHDASVILTCTKLDIFISHVHRQYNKTLVFKVYMNKQKWNKYDALCFIE